ncbi:FtsX-like permease family protein [Oceanobacillus sp. CFH 90083]|uniref:FtsX-like permease family protein n=1 Tax=Oceanobacillus sp. CFH 90083 TaxID=2592336 RepID=UPI00128BD417|nr:ABC transporter permease [Oceanobacillus sp. CFH 90083]
MIKNSIQLLIAQKKWSILLCIYMCISITVILSLYFSSDGIKNYLENRAYEEYGEFDGVLYNEPADNMDYATYGILGLAVSEDQKDKISLGWMSEEMFEWSRMNVIEGKLPNNENEVVVEEFYISQIDPQWKIGDTRSFKVQGKNYELKLSGIVENYSYRWSAPNELKKGINDFPNIILSEKNELRTSDNFYAIQLKGSINQNQSKSADVFSDLDNGFLNSKLYYNGFMDYEMITLITTVFQIMVLILAVICIILAFSYYRANYNLKLGIYKTIGFTNKDIMKIEVIQLTILFLVSVIISIPFIYMITNIFISHTFGYSLYHISWKFVAGIIIWLILIFVLNVYTTIKQVKKLLTNSPLTLLKGIEASQQVVYNKTFIKQTLDYLKNNTKSFIAQTIIITFCITSVFYSLYLEKETMGIWDIQEDYYISHSGYISIDQNNQLVLLTELIPFDYERINQLKTNPSIESIVGEPAMIDVVPLIPDDKISQGVLNEIELNFPKDSNRVLIDSQRKYSDSNYLPWNNISYQWVNSEEYEQLLGNMQTNLTENGLIILLPSNSNLNEEDFRTLDDIVLSKLTQNDTQYEQEEWLYRLDGVFYNTNDNTEEVTFVLIGEQAVENGISQGFTAVDITLKDNLTETQHEEIHNEILDTVATVPDVLFQDLNIFRVEDNKIAKYVGFLGVFNFWVTSLLVAISMYLIVFGKFLASKQRWAIYLANGLTKGKMVGLLCCELVVAYFSGILLSSFIFIMIVWKNSDFPVVYYLPDLLFGFSITFVFLVTLVLCLLTRVRSLSILALIR